MLQRELGGLAELMRTVTEHVLSLCLPYNLIIHHNGSIHELGGNMTGSKLVENVLLEGHTRN